MKAITLLSLASGFLLLSGCERKAPPAESTPTPAGTPVADEPEESGVMVGVENAKPADGEPAQVQAEEKVDLDPKTLENQRVKEEVLKRIDLMPELTGEEKDKLYVQVERARAMGKVITIPFESGSTSLSSTNAAALGQELNLQQVQSLTSDPTVVFVVLGFADKKGDPEKNIRISRSRATSVIDALTDRFHVMNVMHAVGMGSSEMFDTENLDKNRVVEVWAVLP